MPRRLASDCRHRLYGGGEGCRGCSRQSHALIRRVDVAGERILVVDDSKDIRDILRDLILGPRGYKVMTADDGQAGL